MDLLCTCPASRIFTRSASRYRIGYTSSSGRFCQAFTSSNTASVTLEISAGETSTPYISFRWPSISRVVIPLTSNEEERTPYHAIRSAVRLRLRSIQRDDLVVEPRKAGLVLGDDLRLETPVPVPRRLQIDLAEIAFQFLLAAAVAGVAAVVARRVVLLIAYLLGQFGMHRPLQERFRQLLEKAILANDVFRLLVAGQKGVDQFRVDQVDCHRF